MRVVYPFARKHISEPRLAAGTFTSGRGKAFNVSLLAAACVAAFGMALPLAIHAQTITLSGDTSPAASSPASPWTSGSSIIVGNVANGALDIASGGQATINGIITAGNSVGSTGNVTVDGAGSTLTIVSNTISTIGSGGSASLTITNGGLVQYQGGANSGFYIGGNATTKGTGAVTVSGSSADGTASHLNTTELVVGNAGTGTLLVSDGGQVTHSQTDFVVGWQNGGNGAVSITTGGSVVDTSSAPVIVAALAGSTGTVTVDGAGSLFSTVSSLLISQFGGNGTVTVTNGGTLKSAAWNGAGSFIGEGSGGIGVVTIDGANSSWTSSAAITVGSAGNGTLTVSDDAVVFTPAVVLAASSGGVGALNLQSNGVLQTGQVSAGGGTATAAFDGGALQLTGNQADLFAGFSATGDAVMLNAGGGTIDTQSYTVTTDAQAGIQGSGALTKTGSGTLIFLGDNTYTGGTVISAGTLQLGNGGTSGSIVGDVANNGALVFDRSDTFTLDGVISGAGSVSQIGAGTTILTGDNTYTGGTTISAGTLQLGNGGTSGSIVGDVLDNGALAFDRSDTFTYGGVVSGTGEVDQIGSGTTTLTGANVYRGATKVNAGTLQAGAANVFSPNSAVAVAGASTLDLAGYDQTVAGLTNAGRVNMGTGAAPGTILTVSNYVGDNGTIAMNTYLGADNSPTDKLVSTGSTSGSTTLVIANAGGPGAVTTSNGIELVQDVSTTAGAFTLGVRRT